MHNGAMKFEYGIQHPRRLFATTATLVLAAAAALGQLPAESRLSLTLGNSGDSINLSLTNPGNQVWIIQSSSDFSNWTELQTWKVHNGSFGALLTGIAAAPNQSYRAVYDPARQDIQSTIENALLLPGSPFNYAA